MFLVVKLVYCFFLLFLQTTPNVKPCNFYEQIVQKMLKGMIFKIPKGYRHIENNWYVQKRAIELKSFNLWLMVLRFYNIKILAKHINYFYNHSSKYQLEVLYTSLKSDARNQNLKQFEDIQYTIFFCVLWNNLCHNELI